MHTYLHEYILHCTAFIQVGGPRAWAAVAPFFNAPTFVERGGVWDYGQGPDMHSREEAQAAAAVAAQAAM